MSEAYIRACVLAQRTWEYKRNHGAQPTAEQGREIVTEVDRMLAAHDREVKAEAWDEGHSWGWSDAQEAHDVRKEMSRSEWRLSTPNPYRTEAGQ